MGKCVRCTATSGDLALCNGCITGLRMELADVAGILPDAHGKGYTLPSLPEDLHIGLSRQDQLTDPNAPHHGGGDTPLVFRPHIGESVWVLHQVLGTWARELGANPVGMSPSGLARWVLANLDLVQKNTEAAELVDEVTDSIHQARRSIDRQDDHRVFLGRCESNGCKAEIYGVDGFSRTVCERCGAEHEIAERKEWLRERVASYPATAPQVAGFLRMTGVECSASMVRGYAHRGRLRPVWANDRHHPEYLIEDVLAAIRDRYARRVGRGQGVLVG